MESRREAGVMARLRRSMRRMAAVCGLLLVAVAGVTPAWGGDVYVSVANTDGPWLGTKSQPLRSIRDALARAGWGTRIHVAAGRYTEPLRLRSGVQLFGGYPRGVWDSSKRIPSYTKLTLDTPSGHIVTMDSIASATLDGFTIGSVKGQAVTMSAVHCFMAGNTCLIRNCVIANVENYLSVPPGQFFETVGAGISCKSASPTITHCTIEKNRAGRGAGIYLAGASTPFIDGCVIRNNQALGVFGVFIGNMGGVGGGIYCEPGTRPFIQNCVIVNNTSEFSGAGIWGSSGWIANCTLLNNELRKCTGPIRNCIIWGSPWLVSECSLPSYSCIQGWKGGGWANITADPKLQSPATGNLGLCADSPCVDAGGLMRGQATDIVGTPRGVAASTTARGDGSHFDIGAYERPAASLDIRPYSGGQPGPVLVTITSTKPGAVIRYTVGSTPRVPTTSSTLYQGPFWISSASMPLCLQARAWIPGVGVTAIESRYYTPTPLVISQISRAGVQTDTLEVGKLVNAGWNVRFTEIPRVFKGRTYLRTLHADRTGVAGLSFTVNKDVVVYVAMSEGFGAARPGWLSHWTLLADKLKTDDPGAPGRRIYVNRFAAGKITLGVNREGAMPNGPGMYSVIVTGQ